jgi:predicted Fe-S protein YdhL (DUF1289 family)
MQFCYENTGLVLACFGCFRVQREERCGWLDVARVVSSLAVDQNFGQESFITSAKSGIGEFVDSV